MRAMLGVALLCALVVSAAVAADETEPPAPAKPAETLKTNAETSDAVLVLGVTGVAPNIAIVANGTGDNSHLTMSATSALHSVSQ